MESWERPESELVCVVSDGRAHPRHIPHIRDRVVGDNRRIRLTNETQEGTLSGAVRNYQTD
jgi:hypothetical protein